MTTRDRILDELGSIERDHDVRIVLAVESGSRAWGFASTDSDYDVRFVYAHPRDWYLSIDDHRRDVIERPISDELDVSGWDVRKALQLMQKSNPPLFEWLRSPIVYTESDAAQWLRDVSAPFYSPRAAFHHYLHMAQGNIREYLRGDVVWRKKYFYVLRPVLAMRWIERGLGVVPIEFDELVAAALDDALRPTVAQLLADKRAGCEMDRGPRVPALSNWLDAEMVRLAAVAATTPVAKADAADLDAVFRRVVG